MRGSRVRDSGGGESVRRGHQVEPDDSMDALSLAQHYVDGYMKGKRCRWGVTVVTSASLRLNAGARRANGKSSTSATACAAVGEVTDMSSLRRISAAHRLCVLVVEPHEDTRLGLESYLSAKGHHVTAVATGEEGLAWLRGKRCDLLLIAIGLAGREWSFIRQTRLYPAVYGVALTTALADVEKIQTPEFGFRDYLLKPFLPDKLDAHIDAALREHAARIPAGAEVEEDEPCAA